MKKSPKSPTVRVKKVKRYTWEQIKRAILTIYEKRANPDSWGIPSMYSDPLINSMRRTLARKPRSH